ncbi:MAG: aldolase/citrate lyase family protein, partial [Pseudomonadota bacterium]
LGMQNISEIASSSARIESLHFGAGDYSASLQARTTHIGGTNSDYASLTNPDASGKRHMQVGDIFHHAVSSMIIAARANGLRPVDSAYGDFSDVEGYRVTAKRAAAMGCEGKWAIHPSQIDHANEIMGPDADEIARAEQIIEALAVAEQEGRGAVTFEGRMIDYANIRQAKMLVKKAAMIGNK